MHVSKRLLRGNVVGAEGGSFDRTLWLRKVREQLGLDAVVQSVRFCARSGCTTPPSVLPSAKRFFGDGRIYLL